VRLGEGEGCRGSAMGRGAAGGAVGEGGLALAFATFVLAVREKKEEGRRKREEKKRKKKKREKKKKIWKIFREKNKRQFMKLVKTIFVQERNNPNYN
jgi:hypothetical protein